ncbi:MAG: high-potential iron-sulfur protein [Lysobacterales bacterium]
MLQAPLSRRQFLLRSAVAGTALPMLGHLLSQSVQAAELPPLPVDNAQAKALAYVEDATTSKHPLFKAGSDCANCQFFTADSGACALFPGFKVNAKGWCSAWAKKP